VKSSTAAATPSTMASSSMGNHSYEYDLVVLGGGSGGLVSIFLTRRTPADDEPQISEKI